MKKIIKIFYVSLSLLAFNISHSVSERGVLQKIGIAIKGDNLEDLNKAIEQIPSVINKPVPGATKKIAGKVIPMTPLMFAVDQTKINEKIINALLEKGAEVSNWTLALLAQEGKLEALNYLQKKEFPKGFGYSQLNVLFTYEKEDLINKVKKNITNEQAENLIIKAILREAFDTSNKLSTTYFPEGWPYSLLKKILTVPFMNSIASNFAEIITYINQVKKNVTQAEKRKIISKLHYVLTYGSAPYKRFVKSLSKTPTKSK